MAGGSRRLFGDLSWRRARYLAGYGLCRSLENTAASARLSARERISVVSLARYGLGAARPLEVRRHVSAAAAWRTVRRSHAVFSRVGRVFETHRCAQSANSEQAGGSRRLDPPYNLDPAYSPPDDFSARDFRPLGQ